MQQEYWRGLPFPPPGNLPHPGIEPRSLALQADSLRSELWGSPYDLFESESHSVVSHFLQSHGLYSLWNSPGQNTGVGSHSILQGIFPTHGSNPGLPHCRHIFYQLSHKGSPRILEWVAYPFSSESSRPRNWIRVSCNAGGFFTNWDNREAHRIIWKYPN